MHAGRGDIMIHHITTRRNRYSGIVTACIALLSMSGLAFSQDEHGAIAHRHEAPPLCVKTEIRILHSDILKDDFQISISFPADYQRSTTMYPVVLCTDANRNFGLVSDIANMLSFPNNEIPYVIVVGIGYPIHGLEEWGAKRNRDFTPTADSAHDAKWRAQLSSMSGRRDLVVMSGGAQRFLQFLRDELLPSLESTYRIDPRDRALLGYSHGGLFTLYVLFQAPELFQRYYAGSPSIWWDHAVVYRYERDYAATHTDLPVRLFLSAGRLEGEPMLGNLQKMTELLQSRRYPGLHLETTIFDDETHVSCYAPGLCRALKVLYHQ
jgi:uncharacterized protein